MLGRGERNAQFTVDLFDEGVNIPAIDTILPLRPTWSAIIFLQQLGRVLRLADDKPCLTVLDFGGGAADRGRHPAGRWSSGSGQNRRESGHSVRRSGQTRS